MRNYLTRELQIKRDKILYEIWEKEKGNITMQEMSAMFGTELKTLYRILKEQKNGKRN